MLPPGKGSWYLAKVRAESTESSTGPISDDPALEDKKYSVTTKSYHSPEPLRVTDAVTDWQGHSPEAIKAMKDGLEQLKRLGVGPIDD